MEDYKDNKNINTKMILLEQLINRDIKIGKLINELTKIKELQIIRNKEKDKKYKNTIRLLIFFLIISFISNILSIFYL